MYIHTENEPRPGFHGFQRIGIISYLDFHRQGTFSPSYFQIEPVAYFWTRLFLKCLQYAYKKYEPRIHNRWKGETHLARHFTTELISNRAISFGQYSFFYHIWNKPAIFFNDLEFWNPSNSFWKRTTQGSVLWYYFEMCWVVQDEVICWRSEWSPCDVPICR